MNGITELTSEEKMAVGSGFILSLFVTNFVDIYNGFVDGMRDSIPKPR
jgi:hypothetical protein